MNPILLPCLIALYFPLHFAKIYLVDSYTEYRDIVTGKLPAGFRYSFLFIHCPMELADMQDVAYQSPRIRYQWIEGYMCGICNTDQEFRMYDSVKLKKRSRTRTEKASFNYPFFPVDYEIHSVAKFKKEDHLLKCCIKLSRLFQFAYCNNHRLKQKFIENLDERFDAEEWEKSPKRDGYVYYLNAQDIFVHSAKQNLKMLLLGFKDDDGEKDYDGPTSGTLCFVAEKSNQESGLDLYIGSLHNEKRVKACHFYQGSQQFHYWARYTWTTGTAIFVHEQFMTACQLLADSMLKGDMNINYLALHMNYILDYKSTNQTVIKAMKFDERVRILRIQLSFFSKNIPTQFSDEFEKQFTRCILTLAAFIMEHQALMQRIDGPSHISLLTVKNVKKIYAKLKDLLCFYDGGGHSFTEGDPRHPLFIHYLLMCQLGNAFYRNIYRELRAHNLITKSDEDLDDANQCDFD